MAPCQVMRGPSLLLSQNWKAQNHPSQRMKRHISTVPLAVQMEESFGWLPAGWIIEIKNRKGGTRAGTSYKSYIAPKTGCKFYSKQEVFRYLKTGKLDDETPQPKRRTLNTLPADNVVSWIEKSPDGLPPGWTKEIKFRKKRLGYGFRRDPYYTDPVTRCVFRSKSDVIHYLQTGNLGTRVSRPKKMCIDAMNSTDNKLSSPVTVKRQKLSGNSARRCLFESCRMNINGATAEQIRGSTLGEQRGEDADSSSLGCTRKHSKTRQGKRVKVKKRSSVSEDKKLSKSIDDKPLVNGVMLGSEEKQHLQVLETGKQLSQNTALPELEDKKQDNDDPLESRNKTPSWDREPLESGDNNKHTEGEMLSESQAGKPSENLILMESEDTKQQLENQALETEEQVPQNAVLSELEDKKQEKGVLMELRNGMLSGNQMTLELRDNGQTQHGVLFEWQDGKPSENSVQMESGVIKTWGNGVPLESEAKTLLEESQVEGKRKRGRSSLRSSKAEAEKATLLPRRASKRLSGLEAQVALDITSPERAHRVAAKHLAADLSVESIQTGCDDRVSEQLNPQVDSTPCMSEGIKNQPEKPQIEKSPADEKPEYPFVLPFGDSWPDPCLEFAFKTLIGDIPVEESEVEGKRERGRPPLRSSKLKAEKATLLPRRASKRLAGLEAKVALDITSPERAHRVAAKHLAPDPAVESIQSGCDDRVSEQLNPQVDSAPCMSEGMKEQPEKPLIEIPPANDKPESSFALPFWDSWSDPCLEFAFKTLTGDIPEAIDTIAIEDYFQQQLGVGQTQSLGSDDFLQSELLFQSGKDMVGQIEQGVPEVKGKCS